MRINLATSIITAFSLGATIGCTQKTNSPSGSASRTSSNFYIRSTPNGYKIFDDSEKIICALPEYMVSVDNFAEGLAKYTIRVRDQNPDISENDHYKYNELYGYIDETGREVIPAKFTSANSFKNGFALVGLNEKSGYYSGAGGVSGERNYINKKGELLLKENMDPWDSSEEDGFSEGLAQYRKNGRWGYIDISGKVVIKTKYYAAEPFSNGLARVATRLKGRFCEGYILIDKNDNIVKRIKQ